MSVSLQATDLPLVLVEDPLPVPPDRTQVFVIDAHESVPEIVARTIEAGPYLELVGHARDSAEALAEVARLRPQVVLMDVTFPDRVGVCEPHDIVAAFPGLRSLILYSRVAETTPHLDLNGGMAMAGRAPLVDVLREAAQPEPAQLWRLTPRELEVLSLLGEGHDLREIAAELGLSPHTCRGHVKSVLAKLGVHSQLAAVAMARRRGLIASER